MEPRLLVLGAGRHQCMLIRRAEARGLRVVASDYYADAPGKALASYSEMADAVSIEDNLRIARKYGVQGVITSGTDMPLVAMAEVAAALRLPCYLTPQGARTATDKVRMAEAFAAFSVPRAPWRIARRLEEATQAARELGLPAVVKPVDSQGQRGTTRVDAWAGLEPALTAALRASRQRCAMVERFVDGPEITANAWVKGDEVRIQMLTDRITYNPLPAIGICFQHVYPSLHAAGRLEPIRHLLQEIARAYGVTDAPLYVQMLVRGDELFVIEAGCRVGGGHEASLTPIATGIDVLDRLIDLALEGRSADIAEAHDERGARGHALVNFLLMRPGRIEGLGGFESLQVAGDIVEGEFYVRPGYVGQEIRDGQGRVGYFIAQAASRDRLLARARDAYGALWARDPAGTNLLFTPGTDELRG